MGKTGWKSDWMTYQPFRLGVSLDLNRFELRLGSYSMDDLQFSMPFGIEMENAVITKPYSISIDVSS